MRVEITHELEGGKKLGFLKKKKKVCSYSAAVIHSQQLGEDFWFCRSGVNWTVLFVCFHCIHNLPRVTGEFVSHRLTEQLQLVLRLRLKFHHLVIQKYRFSGFLLKWKKNKVSKISQRAACGGWGVGGGGSFQSAGEEKQNNLKNLWGFLELHEASVQRRKNSQA